MNESSERYDCGRPVNALPKKEIDPSEACRDLLDLYGGEVGKAMNIAVIEAFNRGRRLGEREP